MTGGLQIWDSDRSGKMVLDLTSRCTNLVGYVDMPIYYGGVWGGAVKLPGEDFNSIIVPEFSMGTPFWTSFNRLLKVHRETPRPQGWSEDAWTFDLLSANRDQNLECYVNGNTLYYRYAPKGVTGFGDFSHLVMGGHRLLYGVT